MAFADVNGQRLFYEDSGGDGPPVVLSHGFLMDHSMFDAQVDALAPEFRCIRWDERGFGATEEDGHPFTYWDSAADCLGLLDHLGIDAAVLAGMSQGGFLSMRAALTAPERVRALVLIDSQAGVDDDQTLAGYRAMVDAWVTDGPSDELAGVVAGLIVGEPEESARWIARWKAEPPPRLREPAECLFSRDDITDRVGEIGCPALVFHGTDDVAIPMERAEELCRRLGDCRGVIAVEGAAHAANLTHPDQVNPPLLEFLRSLG